MRQDSTELVRGPSWRRVLVLALAGAVALGLAVLAAYYRDDSAALRAVAARQVSAASVVSVHKSGPYVRGLGFDSPIGDTPYQALFTFGAGPTAVTGLAPASLADGQAPSEVVIPGPFVRGLSATEVTAFVDWYRPATGLRTLSEVQAVAHGAGELAGRLRVPAGTSAASRLYLVWPRGALGTPQGTDTEAPRIPHLTMRDATALEARSR